MIHVTMWFKFFEWYTLLSNMWYLGGKLDNTRKWELNWEHLFPRVLGYRKRVNIKLVDITKFRLYYYSEVGLGLNKPILFESTFY